MSTEKPVKQNLTVPEQMDCFLQDLEPLLKKYDGNAIGAVMVTAMCQNANTNKEMFLDGISRHWDELSKLGLVQSSKNKIPAKVLDAFNSNEFSQPI